VPANSCYFEKLHRLTDAGVQATTRSESRPLPTESRCVVIEPEHEETLPARQKRVCDRPRVHGGPQFRGVGTALRPPWPRCRQECEASRIRDDPGNRTTPASIDLAEQVSGRQQRRNGRLESWSFLPLSPRPQRAVQARWCRSGSRAQSRVRPSWTSGSVASESLRPSRRAVHNTADDKAISGVWKCSATVLDTMALNPRDKWPNKVLQQQTLDTPSLRITTV